MKKNLIIIFSDLDGTILHKRNFKFDKIKKYIKKLISHKIILVPNTSKTELEIKDFMKELGIKLPFICENGSAIYNLNLINSKLPKKIILSRNIKNILEIFNEIPYKFRKKIVDLRKIDKKKQLKIFGLPENKLNAALKRKFTIPIKFNGNINEKRKFHTQIKKLGLTIQYGGKISNLGDKVDKSKAINLFLKLVKSKIKDSIKTIGVGDNHNDINMLKNTDIPCLVFNKNFKTTNLNIKKLIISSKPSPQGWADVIKKAVLKIK